MKKEQIRNTVVFVLVFLISLLWQGNSRVAMASGLSSGGSIEGVYKTDFGEMTLHLSGNRVTGTYKYKGGKIDGVLSGNTLSGTWVQDNAKGKMVFVFAPDFSSFTGKWGYNDSAPTSKWNGTQISSFGSSSPSAGSPSPGSYSQSHKIEGVYATDFNEMVLYVSGNRVTGTYKYKGGKIDGVLSGNTLSGTWVQDNAKGKIEFVFSDDFSSFTGKWGNNESVPTSKWNGKKTGPAASSATPSPATAPVQNNLPINVIGSWSTGGSRNQLGRLNIWQNGNKFEVIVSWIDEEYNLWKSYKGEGQFEGRQMNFKVFPSSEEGNSADQGYMYYFTVSPDNNEITGYYTRYGKRTVNTNFQYNRVK